MKNSNEIRVAIGTALNSGAKIAEDGKLTFDDFGQVFGLIQAGQPAIEDAKEVFSELADSTNEEMDASDQIIKDTLNGFTPNNARDISAIENGVFAVMRLIARAKAEGKKEGREEVISRVKAGVSIKDL